MVKPAPSISIVACCRNDNHGGELLPRMQTFVDCLRELSARNRHDLELVLVEWNPPAGERRLEKAMDLRSVPGCEIRVIEVPRKVHRTLRYSSRLHMFQMIAKNCGIRRARGEFICCTNVDIIFSPGLMSWLAGHRLSKGVLYRCDRHDVRRGAGKPGSLDEKLEYCAANVIRVNACDRTEDRVTGRTLRTHSGASGFPPLLHTNACGDFQLMHRDDWAALRGYPEWEIFSLHIDSMLEYSAFYSGIREQVLEYPVYHIEHDAGWKPKVDTTYKKRFSSLRTLTFAEVLMLARAMHENGAAGVFNRPDWGMAGRQLPEAGGPV